MSYVNADRQICSDFKVGDLVKFKRITNSSSPVYGIIINIRNAGRFVFKCEVIWQKGGHRGTYAEDYLEKVA